MRKSWVILLFNDKKLKVWRTYEGNIWGSPLYTVMGYYDGSYRDAQRAYPAGQSFRSGLQFSKR